MGAIMFKLKVTADHRFLRQSTDQMWWLELFRSVRRGVIKVSLRNSSRDDHQLSLLMTTDLASPNFRFSALEFCYLYANYRESF